MNYTLEELKELYDNYEIVLNDKNQPIYVEPKIKTTSSEIYGSGKLYEATKMAYIWVSSYIEANDSKLRYISEHRPILEVPTQEEYYYAFDEHANDIYNSIMGNELMYMNEEFQHQLISANSNNEELKKVLEVLLSRNTTKEVFESYLKDASKVRTPEDYQVSGYSR